LPFKGLNFEPNLAKINIAGLKNNVRKGLVASLAKVGDKLEKNPE